MEFFRDNFFLIDYILGVSVLALVAVLYRAGRIGRYLWHLFWIGAALGLTWELGCNIQMIAGASPVARFLKPLPTHFLVIVAVHSLWDGGLFLAGAGLLRIIRGPSFMEKFMVLELLVMVLWGQAQELAVELVSTYSGGWEWVPYGWNPSLFMFNGSHITLFPQLIWLAASVMFYLIAVKIRPLYRH